MLEIKITNKDTGVVENTNESNAAMVFYFRPEKIDVDAVGWFPSSYLKEIRKELPKIITKLIRIAERHEKENKGE